MDIGGNRWMELLALEQTLLYCDLVLVNMSKRSLTCRKYEETMLQQVEKGQSK